MPLRDGRIDVGPPAEYDVGTTQANIPATIGTCPTVTLNPLQCDHAADAAELSSHA